MGSPWPDGTAQLREADPSSWVAVSAVGASGTDAGVTAADAEDGGLVPTELVALTVKV